MTNDHEGIVYVIDDHEQVRNSLCLVLNSGGYQTIGYESAEAFLKADAAEERACAVLDVRMPGLSGPALQEQLLRNGQHLPIIFLSGHADIPTTVRALKQGAQDFLQKPVDAKTLLAAVHRAMQHQEERLIEKHQRDALMRRYKKLSSRERQVLHGVAAGKMNKEIAIELGLHIQTIKQYRGSVMRKLHVNSLADLVRLSGRITEIERSEAACIK